MDLLEISVAIPKLDSSFSANYREKGVTAVM